MRSVCLFVRIYCCWYWYCMCVCFFRFYFCRFPSFEVQSIQSISRWCFCSSHSNSAVHNKYCIYMLRFVNLNVSAKFLGIKIICTKNSFDFCRYLEQKCAELFSHFALWLVSFWERWLYYATAIGCKWPSYWCDTTIKWGNKWEKVWRRTRIHIHTKKKK